jgi:phenylacetate-CoA ligase
VIRKSIFILAHDMGNINFYSTYKKLLKDQWKSYEELKKEQERQLGNMLNFCYKYVPYYHNLLKNLDIVSEDIKKIEDLEKLPVLTKETIKKNWEDFKPVNLNKISYYNRSTGGSTGTPFKYRITKYERFLDGATIYKGWGYAGYKLGDKMVFLGGSSVGVGNMQTVFARSEKKIHETVRNIKMLSSFDMGEKEMLQYVQIINSFRPLYIYGYPSSLYFFSKWIDEQDLNIHQPQGIFTTAEKLFPYMRTGMEDVFGCDVYDTYGLNDGGVHAFECSEHSGLHITTERSIMEIVDENGGQLENGEGRILATSLYNYAMPFIRYDTGDLGYIIDDVCGCGRESKLLKEVVGRQQEMLETPEGKYIHGEFFTHIFWEIDGVKEFQVAQDRLDKIIIKIVPEEYFDKKQLDKIRDVIRKRSERWVVEFKFVDVVEKTGAGKHKFIINNIKEAG